MTVAGMPPAEGQEGVKGVMTVFMGGFNDLKPSPQLTLMNGTDVAQVRHVGGTHTGPFMGAPATNKKVGMTVLAIDHLLPTGKIKAGEHFLDAPTLMAQLGLSKAPARPVDES